MSDLVDRLSLKFFDTITTGRRKRKMYKEKLNYFKNIHRLAEILFSVRHVSSLHTLVSEGFIVLYITNITAIH